MVALGEAVAKDNGRTWLPIAAKNGGHVAVTAAPGSTGNAGGYCTGVIIVAEALPSAASS